MAKKDYSATKNDESGAKAEKAILDKQKQEEEERQRAKEPARQNPWANLATYQPPKSGLFGTSGESKLRLLL